MSRMAWQQRKDGLHAADCPCGATLAGFAPSDWSAAEAAHFADESRKPFHDFLLTLEAATLMRAWNVLSEASWFAQRFEPGPGCGRTRMHVIKAMDVIRRAIRDESEVKP